MEEQLIFEIWDTFRDHIPEKGRGIAAEQFVELLVNNDVDLGTLEGLMGYDPQLDDAVQAILDDHKEEEEEEEKDEYDDWGEEEEDY